MYDSFFPSPGLGSTRYAYRSRTRQVVSAQIKKTLRISDLMRKCIRHTTLAPMTVNMNYANDLSYIVTDSPVQRQRRT